MTSFAIEWKTREEAPPEVEDYATVAKANIRLGSSLTRTMIDHRGDILVFVFGQGLQNYAWCNLGKYPFVK